MEFLLSTLEIFGLPSGYMEGNGHFPDWGKEKKDDKLAKAKRRAMAQKMKNKKTNQAMQKLKKERGFDKKNEEEQRPTHFDLAPFQKAFKKFLACNAEARSRLRMDLKEHRKEIKTLFHDKQGLPSFKKCVDI